MKLKIYGCRGSTATGLLRSRYGNNTSCMAVESCEKVLILDAGSGIIRYQEDYAEKQFAPHILLSHLHLDHTIGLGTFKPLWAPHAGAKVFSALRNVENHQTLKEQIFGSFKPPYWPVSMADVSPAECITLNVGEKATINSFEVLPFASPHPDETTSFRITDGEKVLVYLLDCEIPLLDEKGYAALVEHCRNADLVVFDAAYTPEDYPAKRTWGHSTVKEAVQLKADSGCKQILLTHFDTDYSDDAIDNIRNYPGAEEFLFAVEGAVIQL